MTGQSDPKLSDDGNNLLFSLAQAAEQGKVVSKQRFPETRGVGYPFVHESAVGGLNAVKQALDEVGKEGYTVTVSKGGRDRYIQAEGKM